MIKTEDFQISDQEASKQSALFRKLREAYMVWERTNQLPNGEVWKIEKKVNDNG